MEMCYVELRLALDINEAVVEISPLQIHTSNPENESIFTKFSPFLLV